MISLLITTFAWPITVLLLGGMLYEFYAEKGTDQDERINELAIKFDILSQEYESLKAMHSEIVKQAEDVKKIVQAHNLKQMFGPKV